MRRDEIDLDDLVWTLPASRTKNRQSHVVHLSKTAADIIQRSMGHRRSEFVFTTGETKPVYAFSAKVKKKLDARSGVSDWRLHDLRRTFASGLAEHGVDIMVADKILNHKAAATLPDAIVLPLARR
jgi:integrase